MTDIVNSLDPSKATTYNNIPIKIFKQHIDIYISEVTAWYNNMIESSIFPDNLKLADITPVHKKNETTSMSNYRPVSVLPTLSKIFEKHLYKQLNLHIKDHLSEQLCGFREGYSTQHCLVKMTEKIKNALDRGNSAGILITDLSKAFDCIIHDHT